VVGFLNSGTAGPSSTAFRDGLADQGFIDGRNVKIEYRFAEGHYERLPALVTDLMGKRIAVLAATGGVHTAIAAKDVSSLVPVVFANGSDPVKFGLVQSLNRPGNMTGISFFSATLEAKRLGLLYELVVNSHHFAALINPTNANAETQLYDIAQGAKILNRPVSVIEATNEQGIEAAFAKASGEVDAMLVAADPFFFGWRAKIVAIADRYKMPAIYDWREYALLGGLASYGSNISDAYRQAGIYVARILQGEKPESLPVWQTTKFEFVLNLRTARNLGLPIPDGLSARADEVIE
jgi:putative ABC transport system substrate-binding protein